MGDAQVTGVLARPRTLRYINEAGSDVVEPEVVEREESYTRGPGARGAWRAHSHAHAPAAGAVTGPTTGVAAPPCPMFQSSPAAAADLPDGGLLHRAEVLVAAPVAPRSGCQRSAGLAGRRSGNLPAGGQLISLPAVI